MKNWCQFGQILQPISASGCALWRRFVLSAAHKCDRDEDPSGQAGLVYLTVRASSKFNSLHNSASNSAGCPDARLRFPTFYNFPEVVKFSEYLSPTLLLIFLKIHLIFRKF